MILDPAATLPTPHWLLVCTGIRSWTTRWRPTATRGPATEALSLQGLRLLARALPAIKRAPAT